MTGQESIKLKANSRNMGKHNSRSLRNQKQVPAVVYGPKIENINLSIPEVDAQRYSSSKFDNVIFTLDSSESGLNNLKVLKKEMTRHPVSRRPVHIDFYALDMTQSVRVNVKLKYVGKPEGLMEGGVAQEIRHDIEVECPATDIPTEFEVNVEGVNMGDVMHVSDVKITSDNIKLITSEEEAIFSVVQPKEEEAAPVVAAEGEAGAAGEAAPAGDAAAAPAEGGEKKD